MIFGDKERFAIECIVNEKITNLEYIFGSIVIWIDTEKLGQSSLLVILKVSVTAFKQSLRYCGNRKDKKLEKMYTLEIYSFLETALWGEPTENIS